MMRTIQRFTVAVLLMCSMVSAQQKSQGKQPPSPPLSAPTHSDALHDFNSALQGIASRISPAVVEVLVSGFGPVEQSNTGAAFYARQHSLGSGVILDPSGYIMTNAHVVEGAQRVQIVLTQNQRNPLSSGPMQMFEAQLVGLDRALDLALLKIDGKNLPYVQLANFRNVRQGEVVLALGSPQGLQNSVTHGVISSVARQPDPDRPMIYVQTDAAINPGNSGGALVDIDGHLVGINTFIYTSGGGSEGLGFAIPAPVVKFAYDSFRKKGHIDRPELGIGAQTITPMMAQALGLARNYGVIISDVLPDTPAAKSGLQVGDILLTLDDQPIDSLPMLQATLYTHPPELDADLEVLRGDQKLVFEVPVSQHKHPMDQLANIPQPQQVVIRQLGVVGVTMDKTLEQSLGRAREASGALIVARTISAVSIESDLRPGDIIHAVNRQRIGNVGDLVIALQDRRPGEFVVMQVEREGALQFMTSEVD